MEGREVKFSGSGTAVVGSWFVKEDDVVREDKVLLWYTSSGTTQQLKSPYTGSVRRIVQQGGQQVATGDTLCFVKACPHDETFNGVCTMCGEDVDDDRPKNPRNPEAETKSSFGHGLFGGVACPELRRSE